jgi:type I restriction enzyme S subunit
MEEQRRIVTLLDEAFADIATAKANAEKNLQNARELFDNALESLVDGTSTDWSQRTMAEVCDITSKLVDPREVQYLDLPHVGAGNIESKTSALVDVKTAREENLISGKFLFDESMVLYSKIRPYLMKVVRPDFNGLCSADIYPLAPKAGVITRDYLYYLLLAPAFTEYAIKGSARAGIPKVNREHLFAYQFVLPNVQDQKRISENLDQIANETICLESIYRQKLTALDDLKKSLLHQAFSGQL